MQRKDGSSRHGTERQPEANPASAGFRGVRRLALIGLAVVVVAAAGGSWLLSGRSVRSAAGVELGSLPRGASRSALNLVVVTLDTTRADRIGAYGARDVETPAIDALAREGVLFEQAVAVAPLTLPAHSSIFTGKFPPEHGVRDNGGFFLGPDQVTLAGVLKAKGYRTGGFVAAYVLDHKWGIAQGFDTYFDDFDLSGKKVVSLGSIQRPGNEVVDKALPWIEQASAGRFFAWIHLYDPHTPYAPPEPFASRYAGHPYNGEVAFVDSQVARVVDRLKALGVYDRTVIAVVGDHGESLGDHGETTHGFFIYNSVTHVPFVIRAPFSLTQARRVADPVREVDVMPTVLDLLGVEGPAKIAGVSLTPLMTGAKKELGLDAYSEAMYPLHHYGWNDLRALRAGRYKVIDAPRPELYDIDRDPGETKNLFEERRSMGDAMLAQLRRQEQGFDKATASMPAEDVDPESRARLAALGYVGSFVASASEPRTGRADPKDKIGLFNKLNGVTDLARESDDAGRPSPTVIATLEEVLREDPQVIDAWFMLGTHYLTHREPAKSIEYLKKALSIKPDYDLAVMNLARAYRALGDDDAALSGFERYLQLDPKDAYVRYQMGEIWLDRGNREKAEALFRQALELDSQVAAAKNALGVIALDRGDVAGAERLVREALAIKPKVRLAHYNLALIAEKRGDVREAEREYLAELKDHPETYKAAFNLSRLYHEVGDREGEIEALKQSIVSNPQFPEGHFYLARAYLEAERLDEAAAAANEGLKVAPKSEYAALGHYVLADVLNRKGRASAAAAEVAAGRAIEARTKK
jgi:choline-sulfatase